MRAQKFAWRTAGVLLVAIAAHLTQITPASAVTCTYSRCIGKDPQAAGCATGATTWKEWTDTHKWGKIRIELRHSAACHSVWVRTTSVWCNEGPYNYHEPMVLGGPQMETGYIDYYGQYHQRERYSGPKSSVNCGQTAVDWTAMSTEMRERIRLSDYFYPTTGTTYITTCNDCKTGEPEAA